MFQEQKKEKFCKSHFLLTHLTQTLQIPNKTTFKSGKLI